MATTWSYTRLSKSGMAQPTLKTTTVNPSAMVFVEATGPATSLSDGSAIASLASDLAAHCYGGAIIGRNVTSNIDFRHEIIFAGSNTTGSVLIKTIRPSTGALLTAATDLSGEKVRIVLYGADKADS